jgi:peptide-methionine (R)-S-oxide reductase
MKRRNFLKCTTLTVALSPFGVGAAAQAGTVAEGRFDVSRTPDQWRAQLGDDAYAVLREGDTERAFTSPLNDEVRAGVFHCKGCDQALYSSKTKFKSGTGWPSFFAPLSDAVETMPDRGLFTTRTEVHCDRCGGHLGHVFDDGPAPTGKRHCINGLAMTFAPAAA